MNNLHNIISSAIRSDLKVSPFIKKAGAEDLLNTFIKKSSEAICFNMGDFNGWRDFKAESHLVTLPYPVSWFEASYKRNGKTEIAAALCWEEIIENSKEIILQCFIKAHQNPWMFIGQTFTKKSESKIEFMILALLKSSVHRDLVTLIRSVVFSFLTALNCNNVTVVENKPPKKLQRKRIKRGKLPLFSYWTLHLKLPKSSSQVKGGLGSHASPRFHLRRGHPREYKPGKITLIPACTVGNKKAGMIHKDYKGTPRGLA